MFKPGVLAVSGGKHSAIITVKNDNKVLFTCAPELCQVLLDGQRCKIGPIAHVRAFMLDEKANV